MSLCTTCITLRHQLSEYFEVPVASRRADISGKGDKVMAERTGFVANARLLQLLVGSNLYPTPDVCVRELLQNAWDAIELRRA
jgi:hypothetical protein